MIRTPKQLGEGFARDLLEMGVIDDSGWTTAADVIATAIVEDRLQSRRDARDTPARDVARALMEAGIIARIHLGEAADLVAVGIASDRHLKPRSEEDTLP
jgi:hypothetical protein